MFKTCGFLLYVFAVFVLVTSTICLFTGSIAVGFSLYILYVCMSELASRFFLKAQEMKEFIAGMEDCDFPEDDSSEPNEALKGKALLRYLDEKAGPPPTTILAAGGCKENCKECVCADKD